MKKRTLRGSKTYWIAQDRAIGETQVFRTRKDAVHFIDHHTDGWADSFNAGSGWSLFQCAAVAEHLP